MGPQVPLEAWSSISILNGCQMCVRGGRSVSVFHVSSQRDEQGSSWRWTETALAFFTIPPFFILPFQVMLSCFPPCNILVLIKANKGKHSVMGEERKIFWFPVEPDSSLFISSLYKSCGSLNGWTVMPCVNDSLSWLQRSSRQTALLLLTAMVPNSMLQWSTSIACAVIQYQFPLKEFVIHQSNCRIEMVLYYNWHLSEHNWRPIPFWQCNSHPNCLIGIQVSHKHLCWNCILLPQVLNTAAHISSH